MFVSKLALALLLMKNASASSCVSVSFPIFYIFKRKFISQVGYKFVVKSAKNCNDDDQVIKLLNSSIEINDKCETFSRSCSEIKPYKNAMVKVVI